MFQSNTVEAALGPLTKVQKNLEAVAEKRNASAITKRSDAERLLTESRDDEAERNMANAVLANITKLITSTPEV